MIDVAYADISTLGRALRTREIGALELATETLERLDKAGHKLNAIASLLDERTLDEARRSDLLLSKGNCPQLCGIPYGVKDLLAARGAPTTWGVPAFREQFLDFDSTVITKLRRRGAVLSAKLSLVELAGAGGPVSIPGASLHGSTRNPWNLDRYSGGSSSGSAAAVAAGLLPFALGTETGGSIGLPSAYCGLTGLRPTLGLVSRFGALVVSPSLDRIGPIAHNAIDCGLVLDAIAGKDTKDTFSVGRATYRRSMPRVKDVRIGFAEGDLALAGVVAQSALETGVNELRQIVESFVHTVIPQDFGFRTALHTIMVAESSSSLAEYIHNGDLDSLVDDQQRENLRAGLGITAATYLQAQTIRFLAKQAFKSIFRNVDVLLSFGSPNTAPYLIPRNRESTSEAPAFNVESSVCNPPNNLELRAAANLAGLPGIFFPCGIAKDGLPVGLHLVGPKFSESLLVAIATAYQSETNHHLLRPPDLPAN